MKALDEARAEVLSVMPKLPVAKVRLTESLGRVTAEDAVVREALPPFDNSAMDGYAVMVLRVRYRRSVLSRAQPRGS